MILKFTLKAHLTFRISFEKDGYNETVLPGSISTLKLFLILSRSMALCVLHLLRIMKEIRLKSMKRHFKGKKRIGLGLLTLNQPMWDQCFSPTKELKL